jgi:hypothetical protein
MSEMTLMTLKTIATAAAVLMVAAAHSGCSAIPPSVLGASTQAASAPVAAPAPVTYAATSPSGGMPGEPILGADPDANVRFDLARDAAFHRGAN